MTTTQPTDDQQERDTADRNKQLLAAAVRLNSWLLAGVFACVFGLSLFVLTYISLFRGLPDTGQYLNLLGIFLPGYEVSHAGAWIGLFWGAALGAFLANLFYRIYARGLATQLQHLTDPASTVSQLDTSTLYVDGKSLGLALGAIAAAGLIVSTNWLVLRGTADQSMHALLLVNYLPGYSISFIGSLIGAFELFIATNLFSWLFAGIYNRLASPTKQPVS